MDINVYVQFDSKKLDEILQILQEIKNKEVIMSTELDALTVQVEQTMNVEQSAITLIQGIAQQLAEIKEDPAKVQALSDQLKTSADSLAAAITANTPAAPPA